MEFLLVCFNLISGFYFQQISIIHSLIYPLPYLVVHVTSEVKVDNGHVEKQALTGSGCRDHRDCHQWGECVFGESRELGYCKCRGWYTGDGVRHCGPPKGLFCTFWPITETIVYDIVQCFHNDINLIQWKF